MWGFNLKKWVGSHKAHGAHQFQLLFAPWRSHFQFFSFLTVQLPTTQAQSFMSWFPRAIWDHVSTPAPSPCWEHGRDLRKPRAEWQKGQAAQESSAVPPVSGRTVRCLLEESHTRYISPNHLPLSIFCSLLTRRLLIDIKSLLVLLQHSRNFGGKHNDNDTWCYFKLLFQFRDLRSCFL